MSTLEGPLNPTPQALHERDRAPESASASVKSGCTVVQSTARITLTLLFTTGFAAVFATQIYATLR